MKKDNRKVPGKGEVIERIFIITASILLLYLLVSLYFKNHFFFNTIINGVNVSLKSQEDAEQAIKSYIDQYKLCLIERNKETETIIGPEISLQYNEDKGIREVYRLQKSLTWAGSLLRKQNYTIKDLYRYHNADFQKVLRSLHCLNDNMVEPKNVGFIYTDGAYDMIAEEYGNKINKERLSDAIKGYILSGKTKLDLNMELCYKNPNYTFDSVKTRKTRGLLNQYVSAKITYHFGNQTELVDGNVINRWLKVDDNLDIIIDMEAVKEFIKGLSREYDTVGKVRSFKNSAGKTIEIGGGLYGWKINQKAEAKALIEIIKQGKVIEREPVYSQKALTRGEDEIGNTYIEISITKQHLWFYKKGKLIAQGSVVTGNPNRGNSTVVGIYSVVYKQKEATLSGPGYDAKVTYWMPFYGNMGIHDAPWRYSFGGEIYQRNGTHGCVNAPFHLAKKIFENIEEGIPVIIYKD